MFSGWLIYLEESNKLYCLTYSNAQILKTNLKYGAQKYSKKNLKNKIILQSYILMQQ